VQEESGGDVKFGSTNLLRMRITRPHPTSRTSNEIEAREGRYFGRVDEDNRRNVTFIGADVADKLFPLPTAGPNDSHRRPAVRKLSVFGKARDPFRAAADMLRFHAAVYFSGALRLAPILRSQRDFDSPETYDDAVEKRE